MAEDQVTNMEKKCVGNLHNIVTKDRKWTTEIRRKKSDQIHD